MFFSVSSRHLTGRSSVHRMAILQALLFVACTILHASSDNDNSNLAPCIYLCEEQLLLCARIHGCGKATREYVPDKCWDEYMTCQKKCYDISMPINTQ